MALLVSFRLAGRAATTFIPSSSTRADQRNCRGISNSAPHHAVSNVAKVMSAQTAAQAQAPGKKQQDIQATYSNYKQTLQQIAQKIGDIEQEAEEHKLVLETLEPLSEDRKCFRLINGVLIERTVKDVVPALKTNQDGLKKVLDDLVKQYKAKQDDLDKWKKKNNVQVVQQ